MERYHLHELSAPMRAVLYLLLMFVLSLPTLSVDPNDANLLANGVDALLLVGGSAMDEHSELAAQQLQKYVDTQMQHMSADTTKVSVSSADLKAYGLIVGNDLIQQGVIEQFVPPISILPLRDDQQSKSEQGISRVGTIDARNVYIDPSLLAPLLSRSDRSELYYALTHEFIHKYTQLYMDGYWQEEAEYNEVAAQLETLETLARLSTNAPDPKTRQIASEAFSFALQQMLTMRNTYLSFTDPTVSKEMKKFDFLETTTFSDGKINAILNSSAAAGEYLAPYEMYGVDPLTILLRVNGVDSLCLPDHLKDTNDTTYTCVRVPEARVRIRKFTGGL